MIANEIAGGLKLTYKIESFINEPDVIALCDTSAKLYIKEIPRHYA